MILYFFQSPSKPNNKTSFSPTLARLLTAPERAAMNNSHTTNTQQSSAASVANVSITDLLSTSKVFALPKVFLIILSDCGGF